MAAPFATVEDYTDRAGGTLPEGTPKRRQVESYLIDASAIMRRHIPAGYTPDEDTLRAVCIAIVRRVIANPGGRRQRTIGQYSETLGEDGGLYLTADEIAQLQPDDESDPDADAAYSVELADHGLPGWQLDPCDWRHVGYARRGRL